jgi:thiamine-phosphate pyrophosphorylase
VIQYAITDGLSSFASLAAQNVDFVQLRNKTLPAGELLAQAQTLLRELPPTTKLLVNGRVDVALAAGAAGVHLTAHMDELTPEHVRSLFEHADKSEPLISVSCHTFAEVERASEAQVDLILFGPVFEKRVGSELVGEGVGLEALRNACAVASGVPVLALGGVTAANTPPCLDAGAAGVAGIRLFQ